MWSYIAGGLKIKSFNTENCPLGPNQAVLESKMVLKLCCKIDIRGTSVYDKTKRPLHALTDYWFKAKPAIAL